MAAKKKSAPKAAARSGPPEASGVPFPGADPFPVDVGAPCHASVKACLDEILRLQKKDYVLRGYELRAVEGKVILLME